MEEENATANNTAKEQINSMKKEISKIKEERDAALGTAFSNTEMFEKKITALEEQISTLNDANADMHMLRERVDELSDELCSKVNEISSLEEKVSALTDVNEQKSLLDARVKEQHLILSTMREKNDELFTTNEQILAELKSCQEEAESHTKKILQLQEENSSYKEKFTRGEEKVASVLANLQSIKEANATKEGTLTEVTAQCETLNKENNKLCKQIAILEDEVEEKSNRIADLEKEEESLITKINNLVEEVDTSKDTIDSLQRCRDEYETLVSGMEGDNDRQIHEQFKSLRQERDEAQGKCSRLCCVAPALQCKDRCERR